MDRNVLLSKEYLNKVILECSGSSFVEKKKIKMMFVKVSSELTVQGEEYVVICC